MPDVKRIYYKNSVWGTAGAHIMTPSSNYAMINCSSTSNGWYFQMVGDASGSPGVAFQSTQNPSVYDYNSCNTGSYYSVGFSTTVYTLSITTGSPGCNGGVNNGYSESLSFLSFFLPRHNKCELFFSNSPFCQ